MTLEKREDTSKIKPSKPTEEICHVTAVQIRVIRYDIFPSSYSFISSLRPLHSPLAKSPTTQAQVATNDGVGQRRGRGTIWWRKKVVLQKRG
ncbi:unnamed protein product, partial [Vitis vinifera]